MDLLQSFKSLPLSTIKSKSSKMSLKFVLISAIIVSAAEASLDIKDLTDLGLNKTVLLEKIGTFFDFQNAGKTQLGKFMAWKGDLIQPVVMIALGVFVVYSTISLLLSLITGIVDVKATIIGNIFNLFQTIFTVFIEKLLLFKNPILAKFNALAGPAADDMTPAANRRRRAIDELSNVVMDAINKYN